MTAELVAGLLEDGRKEEAKKAQEADGIADADVVDALKAWAGRLRAGAKELREIEDHPFPEEQETDAVSFEDRAKGIEDLATSI